MEIEKIKEGFQLVETKKNIEKLLNNKTDTLVARYHIVSDEYGKEVTEISQSYKDGYFKYQLADKETKEVERLLLAILKDKFHEVKSKISSL